MLHSLDKSKQVYDEANIRLANIKNLSHRPTFKINSSTYRLHSIENFGNNPSVVSLTGDDQITGEHEVFEVHLGEFGWNEDWNKESHEYPFCGHSVKNFINNIIFDLRYGVVNVYKNKSN